MKTDWRKYAPLGLIISVLAALTTGALYLLYGSLNLGVQISLAFIIIGLALYAYLDPKRVRETFTGRQAKYGSNTIVMFLAFTGILIVINYLAHGNNFRWDLTEDKAHTLTQESIETLNKLTDPVSVKAFFTSRYSSDNAKKLLESYEYAGNNKFSFEFVDPEKDPVTAQAAKVSRDGTIVLYMKDRMEQVTYASEQEITSAIIRLANPGTRTVYFLTGHGEFDIADTSDTNENSLSFVKQSLEAKNYTVSPLNLLSTQKIPEDALAIIIPDPQKPLSEKEVEILDQYLSNGKALIYLTEPQFEDQSGSATTNAFESYLSNKWGISIGKDIVIDPSVNPPLVAVSNSYGTHPITEKLMGLATIFPTSRSVHSSSSLEGVTLTTLVTTSQNAWGETDYASIQNNQVSPEEGKDFMGPVPLAIAAENSQNNSKMVVFGDAQFITNQYFQSYGNGDLIINTIDWASGQENMINLTPKSTTKRTLVTPTNFTMSAYLLIVVFLMPGIVIVFGILSWLQRRRRG